jgi:hypothetical protein
MRRAIVSMELDLHRRRRLEKVFLNVTGDPKLAHRLASFLDLEFEDTGIQIMNTEANADAEVDAEVNAEINSTELGIGVMKLSSTANGKTEITSSCESLGTPVDSEFFASSTDGLATQLREKYANTKTVKIDAASDTTFRRCSPISCRALSRNPRSPSSIPECPT